MYKRIAALLVPIYAYLVAATQHQHQKAAALYKHTKNLKKSIANPCPPNNVQPPTPAPQLVHFHIVAHTTEIICICVIC